jgi:hypothetical protein
MVDLQPGQTYRAEVNGCLVEVRVFRELTSLEPSDQTMHDPWAELPFHPSRILTVALGAPQLPAPFAPDESDFAPE